MQKVCGLALGWGDVVTAGWDQGREAGELWVRRDSGRCRDSAGDGCQAEQSR
jgi:hypothetical protein